MEDSSEVGIEKTSWKQRLKRWFLPQSLPEEPAKPLFGPENTQFNRMTKAHQSVERKQRLEAKREKALRLAAEDKRVKAVRQQLAAKASNP